MQRIACRYPLDIGGHIEDTVLIAGVGRSGTTWLADFINFDNGYRDLFEPFHAWMIPEAEALKGHWYQRPGDEPLEVFTAYLERVLRGRMHHPWIDRFNQRIVSRRRMVKVIRANLFLGWLADRYPGLKIVLLIRHPAAVARSRLRLHDGWDWRPTLAEMLEQPRLAAILKSDQRRSVADAVDTFDEYLLTWSISHWIPLTDVPAGRVLPVYYEHLRSEPETQMRRIFEYLERDWNPACLATHRVPSKTARSISEDEVDDHGCEAPWIRELSDTARERMANILKAFGLSRLYYENGWPSCPVELIFPAGE